MAPKKNPVQKVNKKSTKSTTRKKTAKKASDYTYAVGRRRTATARIRLYAAKYVPGFDGKVQLVVNGKPAEVYFPSELEKANFRRPFTLTGTLNTLSSSVKVQGSGKASQLDAVLHGLSRALVKLDTDKHRPILKEAGLLTRDPRKRERRKVGTGGKARRKRQSPKR